MQAAQSVLLIVADDMQPSDIHALRHLHAPPILAETPWQALEHVPIWKFEPADCFNLLLTQVRCPAAVQVAAGCRWAAKQEACTQLASKSTFARCCCSGPSRPVLDNHTIATCLHAPRLRADTEGLPTPSLDRLVKEGVAVSRTYSPQCARVTRIAKPRLVLTPPLQRVPQCALCPVARGSAYGKDGLSQWSARPKRPDRAHRRAPRHCLSQAWGANQCVEAAACWTCHGFFRQVAPTQVFPAQPSACMRRGK